MADGAQQRIQQRAGQQARQRAEERSELRRVLRQRRAGLSEPEQVKASEAVADRLVGSELLSDATVVAGYMAARGELDIDAALARLTEQGMTVTVPRVTGDDLEFVRWKPDTMTVPGAFDIAEPVAGEIIPLSYHQAVLAPMVAFDSDGNRLGQGGGYYDRALAAVRAGGDPDGGRGRVRVPLVIGIAHSFARVHSIAAEPWDQRLDAAVTERQTFDFRQFRRLDEQTRGSRRSPAGSR